MGTVARAKKSSSKRRVNKPNDKYAHKLADTPLEILQRVLVLVGKPFYYLISATLIALIFIVYSVGNAIRHIIALLVKYSLILLELIGSTVITFTTYVLGKSKGFKHSYVTKSKKYNLVFSKRKRKYSKLLLVKKKQFAKFAKDKRKRVNFSSYYLKIKKKTVKPIGGTYFLVADRLKLLLVTLKLILLKLSNTKIYIPIPSIRIRYLVVVAFLLTLITIPVIYSSVLGNNGVCDS